MRDIKIGIVFFLSEGVLDTKLVYTNLQDVWSHETNPTLLELKCDLSLTLLCGSFKEPKG